VGETKTGSEFATETVVWIPVLDRGDTWLRKLLWDRTPRASQIAGRQHDLAYPYRHAGCRALARAARRGAKGLASNARSGVYKAVEASDRRGDLCAPAGDVCARSLACLARSGRPDAHHVPGDDHRANWLRSARVGVRCQYLRGEDVPPTDRRLPGARGGHCPAREALFGDKPPTLAGICVGFVPEGFDCDRDWDEATRHPATRRNCASCEPGTQCVSRTCRRAFESAIPGDSCACDDRCKDGFCLVSRARVSRSGSGTLYTLYLNHFCSQRGRRSQHSSRQRDP
jgi:hypothetical protein